MKTVHKTPTSSQPIVGQPEMASLGVCRHPFRHAFMTVGVLGCTILITELLRYYFHLAQHILVLLYVVSVLLISCAIPGYACGFVAAVAGALVCDFLIVSPRLEFSFSAGPPGTLLTLLLVTVVTSTLTSRLRQQNMLALSQQKHFEILYNINRELLSARSVPAIVALLNTSLAERIRHPVIFHMDDPTAGRPGSFLMQPDSPDMETIFLNGRERQKVHLLFQSDGSPYMGQSGARANPVPRPEPGPGPKPEPGAKPNPNSAPKPEPDPGPIRYQPIQTSDSIAGVIGIYCGNRPLSPDEAAYVNILSGQVALAFEVQYLSDRQEKLLIEAEKEKTRSVLLRSISHDFRTPVAMIRGAGQAMREHPGMAAATRDKLLDDIDEYADWLIRTMENILTITRLSDESLQLHKVAEAAEEVVAAAVAIIRKRYPNRLVQVQVPDRLLIVPMDATLIAQVLINLLENATKNSPGHTPITVRLTHKDKVAIFQVIDQGTGLSPQLADGLFRTYQLPHSQIGDAFRGKGIGLSICHTIIHAHHGVIEGQNAPDGGAVFSFTLPMEEPTDAI